jgi:hypothetical protein
LAAEPQDFVVDCFGLVGHRVTSRALGLNRGPAGPEPDRWNKDTHHITGGGGKPRPAGMASVDPPDARPGGVREAKTSSGIDG